MDTPAAGTFVSGNLAPPLKLGSVNLHGFAASAALPGENVRVVQRCALTSEQHMFHVAGKAILEMSNGVQSGPPIGAQ
jgi:hypothetical protein